MVEEVKIEVTADASKAQKALKDTDYWIKALKADTELLKDFQVEYKEALAESGGRRTEKVKSSYAKVLRLQSAIVQDKREIEKLDKKEEKHVKGISKAFKGLGKLISVGAIIGTIRKSIGVSEEGRQDLLRSQQLGLSGGTYEAITSGFSSLGVSINEVNQLFGSLRDATMGAKTGLGDFSQVMSGLGYFGVKDALNKTPEQIMYDLADWASKNNTPEGAFMMRQRLGISQAVFNELAKGSESLKNLFASSPERFSSLTENQLKDQKNTAEAWAEAVTIFNNAVKSLTTGAMGEYLRAIAHWIAVIGRKIANEDSKTKKEAADRVDKVQTEFLRSMNKETRMKYVKNKDLTAEQMFQILGSDKEIKKYNKMKDQQWYSSELERLSSKKSDKDYYFKERLEYKEKAERIIEDFMISHPELQILPENSDSSNGVVINATVENKNYFSGQTPEEQARTANVVNGENTVDAINDANGNLR